jgi:N-acyl-D-amino-acid deacylase
MRNEGQRVFEAVDEMIEIHRRSGARVHIAHLKIASKQLWGQAERLYERIRTAQAAGVPITADMYPYNASSTGITNVLPGWALEGGVEGAFQRLKTPGPERERIYEHLCQNYPTAADGDRVYIVTTMGRYPLADDKTARELSEALGVSVPEALMTALIESGCQGDGIFHSMNMDDVYYLLGKDVAIGSDGSGRPYDPAMNNGKPHPRAYGTFTRFLRLRRERNLCDLQTAIYRITKKPAGIVGLKDRGVLKPGFAADITVFDEATVADTATFQNPFQKPVGIHHVLMGGRFAIRAGEQTAERLGSYLLRSV